MEINRNRKKRKEKKIILIKKKKFHSRNLVLIKKIKNINIFK